MALELRLVQWNAVIKTSAVTQKQGHQLRRHVTWSRVHSGLLGHGERWIYVLILLDNESARFPNSAHIDVFAKSLASFPGSRRNSGIEIEISFASRNFWLKNEKLSTNGLFTLDILFLYLKGYNCHTGQSQIDIGIYMQPHFTGCSWLFLYLLYIVLSILWQWQHATKS